MYPPSVGHPPLFAPCDARRVFVTLLHRNADGPGSLVCGVLESSVDFELVVRPQSNIVCFRYVPEASSLSHERLNAMQRTIRQSMVDSGSFYLVQVNLRDSVYLRTTLVNPLTTKQDLLALLDRVREAGRQAVPPGDDS